MKSLFANLSILAIAAAVIAPAAGAAELPSQTKLNDRFEAERIETLNELTDRFESERIETLNELTDRFDESRDRRAHPDRIDAAGRP